jgi:glycerol-3-phosphate dehydrogenase (NAD(P)+)
MADIAGRTARAPERILVVGGGAWGTALALQAARAGRTATLWAREAEVVEAVNGRAENPAFLPGVRLDPPIRATGDLRSAAADADAVLLVVPAQFLRAVAAEMAPALPPGVPVALCAKGIEAGTGKMMTQVAAEALPAGTPLAVLSGPTFAAEVVRGLPTAVTLAAEDAGVADALIAAIGGRTFRPYRSDDPVGAEVGGAVKNVLAIACGIVVGRRMGDNARAALITRGVAEMTRLAVALGGRAETMMGLSGLGDLVLTCSSLQSRNMTVGAALGEGRTLADALAGKSSVAEGVASAAPVAELAARLGVDMPIVAAVDAILNRGADLEETIAGLLDRPFRTERG